MYVVMSNDYPDAVFSSEAAAESYAFSKNSDDAREHQYRLIFYKVYEFTVDARAK